LCEKFASLLFNDLQQVSLLKTADLGAICQPGNKVFEMLVFFKQTAFEGFPAVRALKDGCVAGGMFAIWAFHVLLPPDQI